MKNSYQKLTSFSLLVILMAMFTFLSVASYAKSDLKALFDRYQSTYSQYKEAVENRADAQTLIELADSLSIARNAYNQAAGTSDTAPSNQQHEPVRTGVHAGFQPYTDDFNAQVTSSDSFESGARLLRRDPLEEELHRILAEISKPDRERDLDAVLTQLEEFIDKCPNEILRREAIFGLADTILLQTGSVESAQSILNTYAQSDIDPESKRQAIARINVIQKKGVVLQLRNEYKQLQQRAASSWHNFSSKPWLAIPVKVWSFGTYAVSNLQRRVLGRRLTQALQEYDQAVVATYPPGSAEELSRSTIIPFNRVRLLANGRTSFHYRYELAKRAQYSINMQTLLYQDDKAGNQLADILIERAQAGVDVRLILDDFFSFGKKGGVVQRMRNGGVKVMINNPILKNLLKANFRSHQKLFVVDEIYAIVGGMNTGDEYALGEIVEWGWRDTDVEVQGPIVSEILNLFERNWEDLTLKVWNETGDQQKQREAKRELNEFKTLKNVENLIRGPLPVYFEEPPVFDNVNARFVITTPIVEKDDNVLDLFEVYLGRAKEDVIFQSAYFIPPDRLVEAIKAAVARGVEVTIITNSIESNNHPYASWAGRDSYGKVLSAGARIFEWQGAQTMHSKVSLFDDFAVTIGAYNINTRSHTTDSEDMIAIEDFRFAQVVRQMLNKDLKRAKEVTMEDVQRWNTTFTKKAKINFFKLFKFAF